MAILDFAGSVALQMVSECPQRHLAGILSHFHRIVALQFICYFNFEHGTWNLDFSSFKQRLPGNVWKHKEHAGAKLC